MTACSFLCCRLCVVNDSDEPVSVMAKVKDYVPIDIVGI